MRIYLNILILFLLVEAPNMAQQFSQRTPEQDSLFVRTQRKTLADYNKMVDLLGIKSLCMGANDFPKGETTLISGDIGFRQHAGGHTPAPNWPTFIQFAEKYFK